MAKKSSGSIDRPGGIEIQRGPINLDEQFQASFERQPEMTRQDIMNNEARRSGQILTKHEPKR